MHLMLAPLLLGLLFSVAVGDDSSCPTKKHIMFFSPPAHSHVALLREIALGVRENYPDIRVTFITGGKYLKMTRDVGIESFEGMNSDENCSSWGNNPRWEAGMNETVYWLLI